MTSAKPQSMASQTEAPDDLIAELARLMADDARSDQQPSRPREPLAEKPAPIRIPGEPSAAAPVRVPGGAAGPEPEPFNFDFVLNTRRGETTPVVPPQVTTPAPAPQPVRAELPAEPQPAPDNDPLDHDGLADLIAAELAIDLTPAEPLPAAEGPKRGEDNFGMPPVFGLGSAERSAPVVEPVAARVETRRDAPVEPKVEPNFAPEPVREMPEPAPRPAAATTSRPVEAQSDALSDIERLIAPAVQKAQQDAAQRAPSPALRSLATPTLPIAEPQPARKSAQPSLGSVDDAILAAAAATGARVEWVDGSTPGAPPEAEDDFAPAPVPRRGFRMSRAVAGPLVAVSLLGIAGFGLYWLLGQGGTPTGPAPLLVADTAAVKDVPAPTETTTPQSVVFNEISGAGNAADEQIVPRDQADEAALSEAVATGGGTGVLTSGDGTGIDPNQDGLVNRKVRTVTVRPDGTIISGADSMAGSAILPVERPNVPEVPGADFSTPDLIASTIAASETATATAPEPAATPTPTVTPVTSGSVVPVVDASGAALSGRTVTIPIDRPADFAQAATAALSSTAVPAAAAPAASTPAAETAALNPTVSNTTSGASAYVQLASQRSEDAARQSAQSMNTRYGVLFSGAAPEIQRVDLGERGIYYRVLVPAASRDAAANICTNIKAAGGDCLLL